MVAVDALAQRTALDVSGSTRRTRRNADIEKVVRLVLQGAVEWNSSYRGVEPPRVDATDIRYYSLPIKQVGRSDQAFGLKQSAELLEERIQLIRGYTRILISA